jgi:hypothetical protein
MLATSLIVIGFVSALGNSGAGASASPKGSGSPTSEQWATLASRVDGRLYTALPIASPCFETVNGAHVGRNETECAIIQQNYVSPVFRSPRFSPRMFVSPKIKSTALQYRAGSFTSSYNYVVALGDMSKDCCKVFAGHFTSEQFRSLGRHGL